MDDLSSPLGGNPPPPPGTESAPRGPGRPQQDQTRRALSDEKYQQMQELLAALPAEAREPRFAIFDAKPSGAKADFKPLDKILFGVFKEQNFGDTSALSAYLLEKFGPGHYLIEAQDEHNQRIPRIATWTVAAGDEDMDLDMPGRKSSRNRRFRDRPDMEDDDGFDDEDDLEDPREERANTADMISAVSRANAAQVQATRTESNSMLNLMLLTQQNSDARRAEDEKRREEQRAEERRREEQRAEERRKEEKEEQRRWEEKMEREREERRREQDKAEAARREESLRLMEASNKRTELLLGAFTALAPTLGKLFEKKEDTTLPLLLKSMEKKETDPMTLMLLKATLDKSGQDDAGKLMVQNMGEMMKVSAQMSGEQMKAMLAMSSEINQTVMKKAMDMMLASPQGQTEEGQNTIQQIMGALASAADIVKVLVPPKAEQPAPVIINAPQPQQQPQQRPVARPAQRNLPAPQAATTDTRSQAQKEWDAMTPEQREAATAHVPTGIEGTMVALQAIQQKKYGNQAELQGLVQYCITCMPEDLRDAITGGDEMKVYGIAAPILESNAELKAWVTGEGVLMWLRSYLAQLGPSIDAIRKMEAEQRAAAAATAPVAAPAAPAAAPEVAPVSDLAVEPPKEAEITPTGPVATPAAPASHLEEDV